VLFLKPNWFVGALCRRSGRAAFMADASNSLSAGKSLISLRLAVRKKKKTSVTIRRVMALSLCRIILYKIFQ